MKDEKLGSDIRAAGRYVGICNTRCQNPIHPQEEHRDVVIHYHIPFLGVIRTQDQTEDAADKTAQQIIYAELSKLYLSRTKELMQLEQLINSVDQLITK